MAADAGAAPARLPVFYSAAYVRAAHEFDTTRKAAWVADSLVERPICGVELLEPRPLDEAELAAAHDPAYVAAVRTGTPRSLAESNGLHWDAGLWEAVCASNGGAVAAALAALHSGGVAGSLSSGLHHAKRGRGDGFCTFNGLALAALAALAASASRVLVLDLDAHCGGGARELLGGDPRVRIVDLAVDPFDFYTPGRGDTLDLVGRAEAYLPTLSRRLRELESEAFALVLYNAGMDPFERCEIGGLRGMTGGLLAERERTVFRWCRERRLPVAFVLAGGYTNHGFTKPELVELHRYTLVAADADEGQYDASGQGTRSPPSPFGMERWPSGGHPTLL
jgi:acetoin utilization deacetylase AcuC-like enzyme